MTAHLSLRRTAVTATAVAAILLLGVALATAGSAGAAVCIPRGAGQPPYCPTAEDVLGTLDALDEPVGNVGDAIDSPMPSYEACWERASDPLYNELDLGVLDLSGVSAQGFGGCGSTRNGGVTIYYPKNYMHSDYFHSGNFNHKLSNWMHLYRANGCNSSFCSMKTYVTNHRNRVIERDTAVGWGTFVGRDFSRVAARPYCGWDNTNSLHGTEGLKILANCYYTYG
jgi:hypothetical protein